MGDVHVMKYIRVVADSNDADYVETFLPISDENLEMILPVIEAIKNFKEYEGQWGEWDGEAHFMTHRNNYPSGECLREDMGEKPVEEIYSHVDPEALAIFDEEYRPYHEYGIHTIESVDIIEVSSITELL